MVWVCLAVSMVVWWVVQARLVRWSIPVGLVTWLLYRRPKSS